MVKLYNINVNGYFNLDTENAFNLEIGKFELHYCLQQSKEGRTI